MPKSCCVYKCHNNIKKRPDLKFYILPTEQKRRNMWLNAIRRASDESKTKCWSPKSKHVYVCSQHFISGKKENFEKHPDFVPSVFNIRPTSPSRNQRKLKRCQRMVDRGNRNPVVKKLYPYMGTLTKANEEKINDASLDSADLMELDVSVAGSSLDNSSFLSPLTPKQCQSLNMETINLRKERDALRDELELLKEGCKTLSVKRILNNSNSDNICMMLTGLSFKVFKVLLSYLKRGQLSESEVQEKLCQDDQILFTIVKLRKNVSFEFLAFVGNFSTSTAINYFWKWVDIMYGKLNFMIKVQDRKDIFDTIPKTFKAKFPRLTCLIDCFEIFCESPKNLLARSQCYSQYKKHCTVKCFISCTPIGAINYISCCWGGRASDIKIVRESQFATTRYHCPGDQILADRGFTLQEDFALMSRSELIIPAFTRGKKQLSARDVENTRKIASVRIHIERIIGLLKSKYRILKGTLPIKTIKRGLDEANSCPLSSIDKIVTVCAALTNLGESII